MDITNKIDLFVDENLISSIKNWFKKAIEGKEYSIDVHFSTLIITKLSTGEERFLHLSFLSPESLSKLKNAKNYKDYDEWAESEWENDEIRGDKVVRTKKHEEKMRERVRLHKKTI